MATPAEISALYNQYLGRDPLQSGVDAWLATNQSIEQIEQGIANSPEAAVFETYQAALGREPEMEERQAWVEQINTTGSVQQAVNDIATSPEANAYQAEEKELDIFADTTADTTVDTTVDDTDETKSTILEDFYAQEGQTITGPRGREITVTEDILNQQLQGELIAAQNFDYVPYGSIDPDDYETDEFGNVIVRVDPVFGPQAASGDALGFSFSDKETANQLFGGQADQVESAIRDINSDIYAITSGAAELGLTLPEEDQQRLRQEAQELYPDASEAELQYVFKELVKDELGIDDFQAEKVRLSEQRNDLLAQAGLDVATMGERAGPQQTLAGTYELDTGQTTFTVDADTGDITTYNKPNTGAIAKAIFATAISAGLGSALGPTFGASTLGKSAAAGIASAGGQLITTGKIDPLSTVASAVTGGLNPGGTLSNSLGLAPDNVVSGFVQGATNNLVSNTITEGELDLQSAVVSGLIGAGINAGKNLLTDASNNSIEAEMERIRLTRELNNDPPLTTEQLYAAALTNANVGKSDLGGLVGEGGLLPFIEPVSTTGINNLLGGGAFFPNEVFFDSEGNRYTDLDILAGAAGEGVSPADIVSGNVEGWTSGVVTQQNTILGNAVDFAKENIPGADQLATTVSGLLDAAAAVEFKNTYGATVEEYLDAGVSLDQIKQMVAYGPLQELYNFSDNPRGTSQIVGTLSSIPGQYSTGAVNNFNVYGDNLGIDVISDALNITNIQDNAATAAANANEGNIAIINLNGTDTVVSSETVLPGANTTIGDAILQGLLDGLLVDTNTNNATLSSGGETTTQTLDSSVVSNISNVLTTAGDVATGRSSFDDFTNTVTDLTNTTGGAGAAAVVDSVVGNTTTLSSSDTDINAGRSSFDDFTDTTVNNNTTLTTNDINAGRSSFDDFSNTSDTIVNNNNTLTNAVNTVNTSDTIVNNNTVLSGGSIETAVPPTTVLPSVESGGGGGGGGGGESLGGGMLSGDPSPPFDIRQIGITAAPILQQRQKFPITESLMGGLLTGNRNRVA